MAAAAPSRWKPVPDHLRTQSSRRETSDCAKLFGESVCASPVVVEHLAHGRIDLASRTASDNNTSPRKQRRARTSFPDASTAADLSRMALRGLALEPLAVGREFSGGSSSNESSPNLLTESGRFRIGGFEIGRDGVTEHPQPPAPSDEDGDGMMRSQAADSRVARPPAAAAPPSIDFTTLQPLQIIGRGASGFVRRAEHLPSGRMMAVKEICISDPARRQQILKEIETLRAATASSSSYLMTYEGVRYTEGSIQIAMTFMDGGSLGDLVARIGPLPADALAAITQQVLMALVQLRDKHLVHRDLKPQNILLSLSGGVKVSDFGCVAELQDSFGKCGTFVGTVPYMSPERIQGQEYGYASDVWALGLSVHECACGHFPYARRNGYRGILQATLKEPSPSLPQGEHPPELVDFVDSCLQKVGRRRARGRPCMRIHMHNRTHRACTPSHTPPTPPTPRVRVR